MKHTKNLYAYIMYIYISKVKILSLQISIDSNYFSAESIMWYVLEIFTLVTELMNLKILRNRKAEKYSNLKITEDKLMRMREKCDFWIYYPFKTIIFTKHFNKFWY